MTLQKRRADRGVALDGHAPSARATLRLSGAPGRKIEPEKPAERRPSPPSSPVGARSRPRSCRRAHGTASRCRGGSLVAGTTELSRLDERAYALDVVGEAQGRTMDRHGAHDRVRAVSELMRLARLDRRPLADGERSPSPADSHIESPLQNLVVLVLVRMDVRRRRIAFGDEDHRHLEWLRPGIGRRLRDDVDASVGKLEPVRHRSEISPPNLDEAIGDPGAEMCPTPPGRWSCGGSGRRARGPSRPPRRASPGPRQGRRATRRPRAAGAAVAPAPPRGASSRPRRAVSVTRRVRRSVSPTTSSSRARPIKEVSGTGRLCSAERARSRLRDVAVAIAIR